MLCHRLALALGGMTVSELMKRMSSPELTNWIVYDKVYGIPDPILQHAELLSTIYKVSGSKKRDGTDFQVHDFLKGPKPRPSIASQRAKFRAYKQFYKRKE